MNYNHVLGLSGKKLLPLFPSKGILAIGSPYGPLNTEYEKANYNLIKEEATKMIYILKEAYNTITFRLY